MKSKPKHTPLPYRAGERWKQNGGWVRAITANKKNSNGVYEIVAIVSYDADEEKANFNFLFRAANSHYKLVEALGQLLDRLDEHGTIDHVREEGPIEDARQALAEAEKEA